MTEPFLVGALTSISGRYAKALFDLSESSDQIDPVFKSLEEFLKAYKSSEELKKTLRNPLLSNEHQMAILGKICEKLHAPSLLVDLFKTLVNNKRLRLIEEIAQLFGQLVAHKHQQQQIIVRSAFPLTKTQAQRLKKGLENFFIDNLNLCFELDSSLLGGIVVQSGSQMVDASLAQQLNVMECRMKGTV